MVPSANSRLPVATLQKPLHCSSWQKPGKSGKRPDGNGGHATSQIGSDCSAVSQIPKK